MNCLNGSKPVKAFFKMLPEYGVYGKQKKNKRCVWISKSKNVFYKFYPSPEAKINTYNDHR